MGTFGGVCNWVWIILGHHQRSSAIIVPAIVIVVVVYSVVLSLWKLLLN